jgi:3-polyprenyl-4-hydroxybenzoate decarboxylase
LAVDVISNTAGPGLDPSRPNIENDLISKLLVDATKRLSGKGFRRETKPKSDVLEKVIEEWDKYGIFCI